MIWEYRVIEKRSRNEKSYHIHEVYYDEDENIKYWSDDPIAAMGCDAKENLIKDLNTMKIACDLPIIKEFELQVGISREDTL